MVKLKDLLYEEDTVADADMKKAKQMKKYLEKTLKGIGKAIGDIEYNLSDFNSPGLKAAFVDGIKAGLRGNKFDSNDAVKKFQNYYKGR